MLCLFCVFQLSLIKQQERCGASVRSECRHNRAEISDLILNRESGCSAPNTAGTSGSCQAFLGAPKAGCVCINGDATAAVASTGASASPNSGDPSSADRQLLHDLSTAVLSLDSGETAMYSLSGRMLGACTSTTAAAVAGNADAATTSATGHKRPRPSSPLSGPRPLARL